MGLIDSIDQEWVDSYGGINCYGKHGKNSQNLISFTSEFFIAHVLVNKPGPKEMAELEHEWRKIILPCKVEPGLYKREPRDTPQVPNRIDDYTCLAAASFVFETGHARQIYEYGTRHLYIWNDQDPGAIFNSKSFFGFLQPGFIVHLKECARMDTSSTEKVVARASLDVSHYFNSGEDVPLTLQDRRLCYMNSIASSDPKLKAKVKKIIDDEFDGKIWKMYHRYFKLHEKVTEHPITEIYKKADI